MISVIIPVYNTRKYIGRCLESILSQTYQDFEIIVVDDGSSDGSGDVVREYASSESRISLLEQTNQGVSVARNNGLDHAKGEYVLFVDGDDYLEADTLQRLHFAMTEHNLDCVSYAFKLEYEDGRSSEKRIGGQGDVFYILNSGRDVATFLENTGRRAFYSACLHLYKRSLIEVYKLRFVPGIVCGEDTLFAHIYCLFVRRGAILSDFTGYNYFQHSLSCIHMKKDPWKHIIFQHIKRCEALHEYLVSQDLIKWGGCELANLSWRFILDFAEIEKKFPSNMRCKVVICSKCMSRIIYPYIYRYAPWRRKLMVCIFRFSRDLFRKCIGIG